MNIVCTVPCQVNFRGLVFFVIRKNKLERSQHSWNEDGMPSVVSYIFGIKGASYCHKIVNKSNTSEKNS